MSTVVDDIEAMPIGFIEGLLGLPLYPWQDRAVAPLEFAGYGKPLVQITVLAPNEGGKSSRVVAGSSMYWLGVHAKGKVGITTKDSKQLNEQIIPALEAQLNKFPGWRSVKAPYYRITTPEGGVLIAFTTDDANRVEGLHGAPDAPLLWIVDEAKSVAEPIFQGIDRCGYQALIYCSSGGPMMGTFYDSHYGKSSASFTKVRAGLIDCPHIAKEKVERIVAKYGEDHPFTRSSVYGEFMEQGSEDEYCFELRTLNNCYLNLPAHRPGVHKRGFWDWGKGVAEHSFCVGDGNKYEIKAAFVEANEDASVGRAIRAMLQAGFKPEDAPQYLWCDASDKEIWKKLRSAGWNLGRKNFGAPPTLKQEYVSWGAESWIEAALDVAAGNIIPPTDDITKAQLISRKKVWTAKGLLGAEDKDEMKERGIPSPDRADSFVGCRRIPEPFVNKQPFDITGWRSQYEANQRSEIMDEIGACAGL